ncbi:hypothetical protein V6N12_040390 [Hibiscus sabdariffa]|uniref:Uncharacterized protein n=1 Tax=Hibiscus sabdariffa TaxID=183260 RepID=A0ABR2E745_9ROSI
MLAALRSTALARRIQFSVVPANLVLVHDVAEAELLIACALLRRYDKCQQPAKKIMNRQIMLSYLLLTLLDDRVNKVHIIPELKEKIELEIRFDNIEVQPNLICNKRQIQTSKAEQSKRMKLGNLDASMERTHQIMQRFAKALWNVVKQDNEKLKVRYDWLAEIIFH